MEAIKEGLEYMSYGVDCVYVGNHSLQFIKAMYVKIYQQCIVIIPGKAT